MPGPYALRDGISFCRFADCAIVLDVDADRYWRVGDAGAETLRQVHATGGTSGDCARLEQLAARGFITAAAAATPNLPVPTPVATSAEDVAGKPSHLSLAVIGDVAWSLLAARRRLRREPLGRVLATVRERRARRSGRETTADLAALAAAFSRARRLLPLAARCLPDSLALLAFLARRGHFPALVFGVEANPFAAHCWIQHSDVVLNDALDHAAAFKPILVV